MRVSTFQDTNGKTVYLTDERLLHIVQEHPEVDLQDFEFAIRRPTAIRSFGKNIKYYYKQIKQQKKYLLIIVKYLNGEGFIITAYLVRRT